ncbi:DUF2442 domain-containing protein [Paraburkholderia madseniana]|jgi:hypothetical protein|uniref:DUF2442 domain-containing protein n=1 Tax=Paraburkholderia madseniana TaxID=2599607 RepID=A0A6N6W229_9BURK|nr:DUF2442 domain-containing protein [Paraburkholderia madseniana]KAE8754493.1 DUF2442 domain-containing protein [Paraburkholderia madseniana]
MTNPNDLIAISVTANEDNFRLFLKDGREFRIPWRWLPRVLAATPEQRSEVRVSAFGTQLRWDQLNEDVCVSALMYDAEQLLLEEKLSEQIPDDFPRDTTPASLSGSQSKLAARRIAGRIVVGLTAPERYERWDLCEDLARQLVPKTLKDAAKYPENTRDVTLRRMRRAIEGKGWTSVVETDWLIQRLRVLLGW